MWPKRKRLLLTALVGLGLLVSACKPAVARNALPATETAVAQASATTAFSPIASPTGVFTVTPEATATLTPTATSTPTPTPTPPPTATFTPTPIPRPTVRIISPASGMQVAVGQQITVQSVASAPAGVVRIDLWVDGKYIASAYNSQRGSTLMSAIQMWTASAPGNHTLAVLAYDTLGQASVAAGVGVTVPNTQPNLSVSILQPTSPNGVIVVLVSSTVQLTYAASDNVGVTRMELWSDGQLYATNTNPNSSTTFQVQQAWTSDTTGDHTLFVRAYDTLGQSVDSAPLIIGMADRNPPAVTIVSPANGTHIPFVQTVPVVISAHDSKGIMHLQLWVNGAWYTTWTSSSPVGESSVQVTLSWQPPGAGAYSIYIFADDSVGYTTTTPPISISVGSALPTATPTPTPTRVPPTPTRRPPTPTATPR